MQQHLEDNHEKEPELHSKQANLSNLPNDLLLHIFSMCNAQTVAQLRQCCKTFDELSNEQIVWLAVLKRTCSDLNLPVPSIPPNACSKSDIELRATAWIRFQLVLRNLEDGLPPFHKTIRSIAIEEHISDLEQTPDGQFLFALHDSGLRVWTLQTPSPILVGSFAVDIPSDSKSIMTIEMETDNSFVACLRIVAQSQGLDQWLAFRFTFSSVVHDDTRLELLSQLDTGSFSVTWWGPWCMPPSFTLLVTTFEHSQKGKHYLLWDFAQGSCATWAADAKDADIRSTMIVVRDFIIAFEKTSQEMVVYALPELPPKHTYAPELCIKLDNPALLHVPAEPGRPNRLGVFPVNGSTSFSGNYSASDYDGRPSMCEADDGSWLLERTEFFRTELSSSSSKFTPLPLEFKQSHCLHIQHPQSFPIQKGMIADACVCPDQSLLLHAASYEPRMAIVFHLSARTSDSRGAELGRGILYMFADGHGFGRTLYSLSPFAGRLCVVTDEGIQIVDFVESPYLKNNATS
ncbi:hypothetical protein DL96DRAFT_1715966 [Flagelloscypha sp. PMI_526]|nr:hypothetical protein DL96DRAFT_1715966 [Flagelloscypha sp. PMI_526]